MNQPNQPAVSPNTFADALHPLQADTDPYFSNVLNVPSGPIGSQGASLPSSQFDQPIPAGPKGHEDLQAGIDTQGETDIRIYQLEDPDAQDSDIPMPIRNAFCIESPELESSAASCAEGLESDERQEVVCQDECGRFVVRENSVVVIDGNEGFDYIDLSDRDIAHVTFGDAKMTVMDANTGESFTIEFQNIRHALFASGQMIELS